MSREPGWRFHMAAAPVAIAIESAAAASPESASIDGLPRGTTTETSAAGRSTTRAVVSIASGRYRRVRSGGGGRRWETTSWVLARQVARPP